MVCIAMVGIFFRWLRETLGGPQTEVSSHDETLGQSSSTQFSENTFSDPDKSTLPVDNSKASQSLSSMSSRISEPKMAETRDDLLIKKRMQALKLGGVHRTKEDSSSLPTTIHIVGLGKVGADFITQAIEEAPDDFLADSRQRFTALALDIGGQNLQQVEAAAKKLPSDQAQVRTLALEIPERAELFSSLRRYREYLKLEFPRYYWNPNYEPWLPEGIDISESGEALPRALTKAIYGMSYYESPNLIEQELEAFAKSVTDTLCQTVVCIVFDLGDSVGNGIVVDLARHLSNVKFGRRALVLGIGIVPCEGDLQPQQASTLFPVLNELDCMLDQEKNDGVVQVWGDLYRDPFTAGFLMVPQKPAWEKTKDIAATHKQTYTELASFLMDNQSLDLYESLRLLNWVGASPTQHSAARSRYGKRWCHIFGTMDLNSEIPAAENLPGLFGLVGDKYSPDFFEIRTAASSETVSDEKLTEVADTLNKAFSPLVEAGIVRSGSDGKSIARFILPGPSKNDLEIFFQSRDVYDQLSWDEKLLVHSWLLELGVLLSEPAIRFQGMAGECLWGCACWVVVPYDAIRGEESTTALQEKIEQVVTV